MTFKLLSTLHHKGKYFNLVVEVEEVHINQINIQPNLIFYSEKQIGEKIGNGIEN
jgi:hypothetical protein